MRRTKEDALKTYRTILDTSLNLFNNNGYNGTTISDIAKSANVTRGAVYWHFRNKGDIFIAIGDLHLSDFKAQLYSTVECPSPLTHLANFVFYYFTMLEKDAEKHKFCALIHRYSYGYDNDKKLGQLNLLIQQHYFDFWHQFASYIICGAKKKGEILADTNEEFASLYIRSTIMGLSQCYFNVHEQVDVSKYSKHVMNEVIQSLRCPAP